MRAAEILKYVGAWVRRRQCQKHGRARRWGVPGLIALAIIGFPTPVVALDPVVEELSHKPLPEIPEPQLEVKTLPSAAKIYYLQNQELPILHVSVFFKNGEIHDTKGQRGLTSFFMAALRAGGTTKMTAREVDEQLEFLAAGIAAKSEGELSSMKMSCLTKDAGAVMDILFDLIRTPAFENERIEIIRKSALNAIKRRNEEPMAIAQREFKQSLYGKDSPHAWHSTPETLNKITPETLKKFHQGNISPDRMIVAASSPLSFREFLALFEARTAGWDKKLPGLTYPTRLEKKWQPSAELIQKAGSQSSVVVGHFGDKRFNPDKFKLILANEILGGSTFGAKLGNRIRTDLGLAYSIGSGFDFGSDYGAFRVSVQTKSESTVRTIEEIQKILTDMVVNQNLTEAEIKFARDKLLTGLVFEYEQPMDIVEMTLRFDFFGYPPNYLSIYQREIKSVTLTQVRAVLQDYFFPDRLKIMVVGDKDKIKDSAKLGLKEIPLDDE